MTENVIKSARETKNLKQEEVAEYVGVTVQTYSKWENGKTEPKASQVAKLAEILKVTEREICLGKRSTAYALDEFLLKIDESGGGTALMLATYNACDHEIFFRELAVNAKQVREAKQEPFSTAPIK